MFPEVLEVELLLGGSKFPFLGRFPEVPKTGVDVVVEVDAAELPAEFVAAGALLPTPFSADGDLKMKEFFVLLSFPLSISSFTWA